MATEVKIQIAPGELGPPTLVRHTLVGRIYLWENDNYDRQFLLRHYAGVISLENPRYTWNEDLREEVRELPPGSTVTWTTGVQGE
jgi:hypothetical protein